MSFRDRLKKLGQKAQVGVRDYYRTAANVAAVAVPIITTATLGPAGVPIGAAASAGLQTVGAKDKRAAAIRGFGEGLAIGGATYGLSQLLKPAVPGVPQKAVSTQVWDPVRGEMVDATIPLNQPSVNAAVPGPTNPNAAVSLVTAAMQGLNQPTALGQVDPTRPGVIGDALLPGAPGAPDVVGASMSAGGGSSMIWIGIAALAAVLLVKGRK